MHRRQQFWFNPEKFQGKCLWIVGLNHSQRDQFNRFPGHPALSGYPNIIFFVMLRSKNLG